MKNLTKRNKIILAIVAALVMVVVAVAIFAQVGGGALLGTASNLAITPSNPTIVQGNTVGLSVNATYNCAWSSSNAAVVSLVNYISETKSVTVKGNATGSATITAKCGLGTINVNQVTTTVTVTAPPPPPSITVNPGLPKHSTTIGRNEKLKLCTGDSSTTWSIVSADPLDAVSLQPVMTGWGTRMDGCMFAVGAADGTATLRATNGKGGSATIGVTVSYPLTMIPANPFITIGQPATLSMAGATLSTTWSMTGTINVTLSATTGQSVNVTAAAPDCVFVTATNPAYGTGMTLVCTN